MKVLIAEDDPVFRRMLESALVKWGYEVVMASNGIEAWRAFEGEDAPLLAILDWMMPGLDGVEVCRKVRAKQTPVPPYLILLTARGRSEDIVAGLGGGVDDYLTKPFNREELRARVAGPRGRPRTRRAPAGTPANLCLVQEGAERPELLAAG